ncbi:retrovirus-related pol polyprotein from transposon TNT 1-94 [Tanacetum coccineum]|uniref:Retrovirus-related pol polyprotein from transposon TNT 1-94 n=1 Tax=Tanacetum coccineum TaxID=301880 RepID=A0ABQ5INQ3_9ASTR
MSTLTEFMIVVGADNHPPMLDKPQYESWKSHMELYIQENGTVRPKTYEELFDKENLQADCDLKATNIVLQGLPPDVYALVNHHKVAKDIWDRVKFLMQGTSLSKQELDPHLGFVLCLLVCGVSGAHLNLFIYLIMEAGFLDSNSRVKDKNKVDLAAKIVNIDGKFIGRKAVRGNPLATNAGDSALDTTAMGHANAHVYVGGNPLKSILETNQAKDDVSNMVREVPAANVGFKNNIEKGIGGIPGTSCTDSPKLQDGVGVSNTQPKDITKNGSSKAVGLLFASMFNSESVSKDAPVQGKSDVKIMGCFCFTKWTPNISLKLGVVTKVPVWVKLYNVLVVAYSEDGLSLIATQIGKPIMLDAFTSSMCVDSWGRISFARALIKIDVNLDLKKEVKMVIPDDEDDGSGYISEVIVMDDNVDNSAQNNDGFTEVVSRKNKGKKVVNQQPKNPIVGLRFHKPKSTFYRPINKKANDKQDKKKPADVKASSSHACGNKSTPISNAFSVLNSKEGAECGDPFPTNDAGSAQNDGGVQNPSLGTEEAIVECEKDSLWSKVKAAKEASKSNLRSTSDFEEESDEDEVYFPNEEYTSGMGGGFSLEEDDLDCYDGYEAHVFDMPGYDIRLNSLAVTTFLPGGDLIACMNKAMAFLSAVFTPRYPSTNNQLRSSSNARNQATVQDGRLAFLVDPKVADGQVAQTITHNAAFQTDDLYAYDSDCDDISLAKAVLMANLSSCNSDVISEEPYSDTSQNDMTNQSVHEFQYSELSPIVDYPDDEITSDSNIIPYS